LLAVVVGADFEAEAVDFAAVVAAGADCDAAPDGAGVAAGAAGAADAALAVGAGVLVAFCLPPWPLHAPLPVAVEVVPSLHVVEPALPEAAGGAAAGAAADEVDAAFCLPP
jgi:hypothetical protein